MLAYVFWHHRRADVKEALYRKRLISFHKAINGSKPKGFLHSTVFRAHGLPWIDAPQEVYEEWYYTRDSSVLDRINRAAVTKGCMDAHNKVAKLAAAGTAGLYLLRNGLCREISPMVSTWFVKPVNTTYSEFYSNVKQFVDNPDSKGSLWGRQMVLGPTSEFCLHAAKAPELPEPYNALAIPLEVVWSGARISDTELRDSGSR
jgi:hypothetical protein